MKIQTLGWLVGVTALVSSASILACSQAEVVCQVGHAGSTLSFAAKYYPVGTPGACSIPGDQVGFETYHPKGGGDDGTQPDFSVPSLVALQTDAMGILIADKAGNPDQPSIDPDGTNVENMDGTHVLAKHPAYALGTFETVAPDADGFCVMKAPKPAVQEFPKVAGIPGDPTAMPPIDDIPELPAESVSYTWTDVKVYVTAAAQGTQFSGHLKYTDDMCSAEYNVAGVWPAISCANEVDDGVDDMGNPKTKIVPEAAFCCPSADPLGALGRITGSGINPDFPMKCDPDLLLCVLDIADASKLPALNPGWDANVAACKVTAAQ
jgi:hypothetical protein